MLLIYKFDLYLDFYLNFKMELSEIDFCNGVGYNLKNIRYKSNLLKSLKTKFNITIQNDDIQFSNKQLYNLKKYNYLLSVLTGGQPYFLYLTKINNKNYSLFIDKKIIRGHTFPKIIITNYRFQESLYNNTILNGELIKTYNNAWEFVINDIIIYKNKKLNKNIYERLKLLHNLLENDYIYDINLEICSLRIKKYFIPNQFNYVINKFIYQCNNKINGLIMTPIINNKYIVFNFKPTKINNTNIQFLDDSNSYLDSVKYEKKLTQEYQDEVLLPDIKDEDQLLLDLLNNITTSIHIEEKLFNFEIEKTNKPNVYILYCDKNNSKFKHSIARIDTLECLDLVDSVFKQKGPYYVECIYSKDFNKWIPSAKSKQKIRDTYKSIQDYINSV